MTYLAFNFCEIGWLPVLLSWLLPFLLGLLLGYAIWAKYKKMKEDLEDKVQDLKGRIKELEEELDACSHKKTDLESEIALLKGQLRERDLQVSTLEASLTAAKQEQSSKISAAAAGVGGAVAGLAASDKKSKDDLQKIEGVGPKIEKLLNEEKIKTYAKLADTKVSKLRKMLDAAGPKYQITKPDTWPEQAALARDGKWEDLKALQDELIGGVGSIQKGKASAPMPSDDLKKIEGIGPKIESLLNDAGITTFALLSNSDVATLRRILDEAGPRYRISNPESWPEQAALARDGKWDDLSELQNNLKGGRKT